jgi:hypothetical protein
MDQLMHDFPTVCFGSLIQQSFDVVTELLDEDGTKM